MKKRKGKSKKTIGNAQKHAAKKLTRETALTKKASRTSKRKVAKKKVSKTKAAKAKRKPQKKAVWKISPPKHGTTDVWVFKKDGVTIELSQTYRFTFVIVPQKPNLTKYDPHKGINIDKFNCSHYEPGDDSFGLDWTFPDDLPLEEQERIQSIWHEGYHDAMGEAGWHCAMDATYFYGDLSVEEVEPEYPYDPI